MNPSPLGPDPIATLFRQVVDGALDVDTATQLAATSEVTGALSLPYVNALANAANRLAIGGDWQPAWLLGGLLVAAVDARAPGDDARVMRWLAWMSRVSVTTAMVHATADGRALEATVTGAEVVLAGPSPDDEMRADLLFRLGALFLDPWVVNRDADKPELAINEWRGRAERNGLDGTAAVLVPTSEVALARSEGYLRRAVPLATGAFRGRILKALVQLLNWRSLALAQPVDEAELVALAREAFELVGDEGDPEARAFLGDVLVRHQALPAAAPIRWEDLDPDVPDSRRAELAVMAMTQLLRTQPAEALAVALRARPLFDRVGDESLRWKRWKKVASALQQLGRNGQGGRWAADAVRVAGIADAMPRNAELEALAALAADPFSPAFRHELDDVVGYLILNLEIGVASNAAGEGDWHTAIGRYGRALRIAGHLGLSDVAHNLVQRTENAAGQGQLPGNALMTLVDAAPAVQGLLGEPFELATRKLALGTMAGFTATGAPLDLMLMTLQAAKGRAFGAAVAAGARYRVSDHPAARDLLGRIQRDAAALPAPSTDPISDELLLGAYARVADRDRGGAADARAANLRQTFDGLLRTELLDGVTVPPLLDVEAVRARLSDRAALVNLYLGADAEGRLALLAICVSRTSTAASGVTADFPSSLVRFSSPDGRVAWQHPVAPLVADLRELVREPTPSGAPSREARDAIAAMTGRLRGVFEWLATCEREGKDELVIVPHGPLHFLPFHLLGDPAAPLATRWKITQLPSLGCLSRPPAPPRPPSVCALGLDYLDDALNPHGLAMIRAARQEAVACAAAMGGTALVDGDATRDRLLAGLRAARYVHFSGHGQLDVAAPAFQTLFLAPSAADDGRLFAFDLLADSFAGCELVSLSACESGLGRFDLGDNLMGIPAALLAGGVRHIVATLWPVAVEPARVFFGLLYGALAGGASGLDAFARAQRETRDRYPALRDWGAFFLTGV